MDLGLSSRVDNLLDSINKQMLFQQAQIKSKEQIEKSIDEYRKIITDKNKELEITLNAVTLISSVSDKCVEENYKFIEDNVNLALKKVFPNKLRQIRLIETMRGQYPQLEFKMVVENGITRTIKSDSGHGIAQVISLLSLLSLIVIRGERKFVALDEMTSGMSGNTRALLDSILWAFAEIGFQFLLVDHGYIPKGAKVYILKDTNGISKVEREYVETRGVYNEGRRNTTSYVIEASETETEVANRDE